MRERVIVERVKVTKRGQRYFFQVKLPEDTLKVTGLEVSFRRTQRPDLDEMDTTWDEADFCFDSE